MNIPACQRCKSEKHVKLRRNVIANATSQVFWFCTDCQRIVNNEKMYIPHSTVNGWLSRWHKTVTDIPIVSDYSQDMPTCEICGAVGVELHHFAPQAMKDDFAPHWAKWPTIYLCRKCHQLWHRLLTPQWMRNYDRHSN